jgi:hypothetical protein
MSPVAPHVRLLWHVAAALAGLQLAVPLVRYELKLDRQFARQMGTQPVDLGHPDGPAPTSVRGR